VTEKGERRFFKDVANTIGMRVLFYELKKKKKMGYVQQKLQYLLNTLLQSIQFLKKGGRSV
jgi:hypothetical protein